MNVTTLLTNPLFLLFELLDGEGSEGRAAAKITGDQCVSWTLRQFFNSLIYFGNQNNWIFYLAFGARFRVHIMNMLMCRKRGYLNKPKLLNSEIPLDVGTNLINCDYVRNSTQTNILRISTSNNIFNFSTDDSLNGIDGDRLVPSTIINDINDKNEKEYSS
ncbi:unnamed protein product [Trichobilharzia szidati]|nr:unnamed protein product [Trichobilharzia szidati]